ncbi:MAG: anti-sigma factor [Actinomycetota bacterium]
MSDRTPNPLATLTRELTPEDFERHDPPTDLWNSIAAAVAADEDDDVDLPVPPSSAESEGATVLSFDRRRSVTTFRTVLAVAAALVVVAGVAGVLRAGSSDPVVSEVAMSDDGLQVAAPSDGTARLVEADDALVVEFELPDLPETDGYYEAWLIDSEVNGMFSLGAVDADGRLTVPSGVDPAEFPIVDISVESTDGDPTHSGQSILRGVFEV